MDRLRSHLPALLLLLAAGLFAVWYYSMEWEEKSVDMGPTQEARRNPVLALQRLLEQREKPVELIRSFAGLEQLRLGDKVVGPKDAVVLLNTGRALRQSQVDALWRWVSDGGRLVVAVDNPYFDLSALERDPFLDKLGLKLNGTVWDTLDDEAAAETTGENDGDTGPEESAEQNQTQDEAQETAAKEVSDRDQAAENDHCSWDYASLPVELADQPELDVQMEFASEVSFNTTAMDTDDAESPATTTETAMLDPDLRVLAAHEQDIFFVHLPLGAGEIFALPSKGPMENSVIHCQDNAFIIWRMLRDSDKVWLVLNTDSPSFWRYLWQLSAVGCIALLAALALWLWYKVPRFGPVLERPVTGRRQFLDHIQASAQFLFRHRGSAALVEPLREEIQHKLRLRQPGFAQLPIDDQIARVAKLSGMSLADVQLALYRDLPVSDAVFIDMVQRLQYLRNSL